MYKILDCVCARMPDADCPLATILALQALLTALTLLVAFCILIHAHPQRVICCSNISLCDITMEFTDSIHCITAVSSCSQIQLICRLSFELTCVAGHHHCTAFQRAHCQWSVSPACLRAAVTPHQLYRG